MILVEGYGAPVTSSMVPSSPMPISQAGVAPANLVVPMNPPPKSLIVIVCGGNEMAQFDVGGPSVPATVGGSSLGARVSVGSTVGLGVGRGEGVAAKEQPATKTMTRIAMKATARDWCAGLSI